MGVDRVSIDCMALLALCCCRYELKVNTDPATVQIRQFFFKQSPRPLSPARWGSHGSLIQLLAPEATIEIHAVEAQVAVKLLHAGDC
jgi:hypothetical protein